MIDLKVLKTFDGIVGHFKFIYISIAPFCIYQYKKLISQKNYLRKKIFLFYNNIISTLSLIFHQFFTKNQTFIFFSNSVISWIFSYRN